MSICSATLVFCDNISMIYMSSNLAKINIPNTLSLIYNFCKTKLQYVIFVFSIFLFDTRLLMFFYERITFPNLLRILLQFDHSRVSYSNYKSILIDIYFYMFVEVLGPFRVCSCIRPMALCTFLSIMCNTSYLKILILLILTSNKRYASFQRL